MADGQSLAAQLQTISTALTTLQTQAQTAIATAMGTSVQNVNAQIADRNSKLDAAKSSVNSAVESASSQVAAANGQIDTANGQIESAEPLLIQRLQQHRQPAIQILVNSLTAAKSNLPSAQSGYHRICRYYWRDSGRSGNGTDVENQHAGYRHGITGCNTSEYEDQP